MFVFESVFRLMEVFLATLKRMHLLATVRTVLASHHSPSSSKSSKQHVYVTDSGSRSNSRGDNTSFNYCDP